MGTSLVSHPLLRPAASHRIRDGNGRPVERKNHHAGENGRGINVARTEEADPERLEQHAETSQIRDAHGQGQSSERQFGRLLLHRRFVLQLEL